MPDRFTLLSFVLGAAAFYAFAVFSLHHVEIVGIALAAVSAVVVAAAVAHASRHRRLVRGLWSLSAPARLAGMPVRTGDLGDAAFVAGLDRPTIFCDRQLPDVLSTAELEAVLLHEHAHQRAWDPARLLALELIAPVVARMPFGRQWLAWSFARREIAADRYAMDHGASRGDLASALLVLPPLAQAHVAGFTSAVDLRLRALLGEDVQPFVPLPVRRA
ncbi:MAG: hypothetical protein WEB03_04135, partial [Nitriliruptor sp.]